MLLLPHQTVLALCFHHIHLTRFAAQYVFWKGWHQIALIILMGAGTGISGFDGVRFYLMFYLVNLVKYSNLKNVWTSLCFLINILFMLFARSWFIQGGWTSNHKLESEGSSLKYEMCNKCNCLSMASVYFFMDKGITMASVYLNLYKKNLFFAFTFWNFLSVATIGVSYQYISPRIMVFKLCCHCA